MINLKTTTRRLRELITPIHVLVDECKLNFTKEGISTKVVDPSNISLISVDYPSELFDSYISDTTTIGLDLVELKNILKYNEPKSILDISSKNTTSEMGVESSLFIDSDGFRDEICLLDPKNFRKDPLVPNNYTSGNVSLQTKRFLKILNKSRFNLKDKYIDIRIEDEKFITNSDNDINKTTSETTPQIISGNGKGLYSIDELLKITKVIKSKTIDIEMGIDRPIKIKFDVSEKGKAEYILAPRIG